MACPNFGERTARVKLELTDFNAFDLQTWAPPDLIQAFFTFSWPVKLSFKRTYLFCRGIIIVEFKNKQTFHLNSRAFLFIQSWDKIAFRGCGYSIIKSDSIQNLNFTSRIQIQREHSHMTTDF